MMLPEERGGFPLIYLPRGRGYRVHMTTKITIIYDNPTDPEAFEAGYAAGQVE